jgi:glutamine amidotransferase PdxT
MRCFDHSWRRCVSPCPLRFSNSTPLLAESTTIALLARLSGVLEPLREFVKTKPVWGTCAGAILLSQAVENAKKGGQELLGGMSITIARNGWGSQVGILTSSW